MTNGAGFEKQVQGRIGEDELRRLCNEARLIPNRTDLDLTGWDFCVEELETASTAPLDCRPAALRCMVQVKTVAHLDSRPDIELVNWERMVTDSTPWFVLVVQVVNRKPTACFLIHVGELWITRTLKRLTHLASRSEKTISGKMGLKWRPEDRVSPTDGPTFTAMLHKAVGPDPADYARQKQCLVKRLGYEDVRYRGKVRFDVTGLHELAEFAVRIRPELRIASAEVRRIRFGMEIPEFEANQGILKFAAAPSPSGRATITVTRQRTGARCTLEFDLTRASDVFPGLPHEHDLMVLRHRLLEMRMSNKGTQFHFTYRLPDGLDTATPLLDIGPASEFIATLLEADADVPMQLQVNSHPPLDGHFNRLANRSEQLEMLTIPLANAWEISQRLGIEDVKCVPRDLAGQAARLGLVRAALEERTGTATLREIDDGALVFEGKKTAVIGYTAVALGSTVCVLAITCSGWADFDTDSEGQTRAHIQNGVFRAHGLRNVSASVFDSRRTEIETELRMIASGELDRLGVVNQFHPSGKSRLFLGPGGDLVRR
jgi:hypothetical protein